MCITERADIGCTEYALFKAADKYFYLLFGWHVTQI